MNPKRLVSLLFALSIVASSVGAQDSETVRVTHRFDWRRTVNKQYQGLVYGYMIGAWKITPGIEPGWTSVEARYELASESRKSNALTEKPVQAERVSRFQIDPKGLMTGFTGDGVPYYRNFPAPLPAEAGPGATWIGAGDLVGDFLGTGISTKVPILIEYRWVGPGDYVGVPVIQIQTKYALRYKAGDDQKGDPTLASIQGVHSGMVSYDASSHKVLFVRETAQESFTSTTGKAIANDGIILTFFEGVPALGTASVVQAMNQALGRTPVASPPAKAPEASLQAPAVPAPSLADQGQNLLPGPGLARTPTDLPDVKIEADPRGVKLTLDNLKFVADQAILLSGEDRRFARIAELLKTVPNRNLLVVGHTAAVGTVESQESLALERAQSIVGKLKAAGLPAQRLLYEGRGGREPVASNETEAGRAQNRRVEILILDQ